MAYRRKLISSHQDTVFVSTDKAAQACVELRNIMGASRTGEHPLIDAALSVQEDICILQKQGDSHMLSAAVMCFPSSWDVREKIGRSIFDIHSPVAEFADISSTVERMLSAIRPEHPLGRANFLIYTDPELHQPRGEGITKPIDPSAPRYIRVERQTFRRLPETLAVVFAIHSYVVPESILRAEEHAALAKLKPELLRT